MSINNSNLLNSSIISISPMLSMLWSESHLKTPKRKIYLVFPYQWFWSLLLWELGYEYEVILTRWWFVPRIWWVVLWNIFRWKRSVSIILVQHLQRERWFITGERDNKSINLTRPSAFLINVSTAHLCVAENVFLSKSCSSSILFLVKMSGDHNNILLVHRLHQIQSYTEGRLCIHQTC